jgi:hypothetical protein
MLPITLLAAIATIIFLNYDNVDESNKNISVEKPNTEKKTFKYLVNDLIDHHGMSQTKWNNNIRINKTNDGIGIGSDEAFILLSDSKPIKLYVGKSKYPLNTWNTNEAVDKLGELINSDKLTKDEQAKVTKVLNLLLKFKNYYFFKKYLHYKKLYLESK